MRHHAKNREFFSKIDRVMRFFENSSSTQKMLQSGVGSMQGPPKVLFYRRLSSTEGHLPPQVVFQQRSSSTEGRLPPKDFFHQRSSSIQGRLAPKAMFHQRPSSTEGPLPPKDVFHQRSSTIEGRLPPKIVFQQRSSSTEGLLPPKVVFYQWLSSTYHDTLVDLILVRKVNIPNLSFLPYLEVNSPPKVVFHRRCLPPKVVLDIP